MRMNLDTIPTEVIQQYSLQHLADSKGNMYMIISKGMYGLKQSGIIAHTELIQHLSPLGYHPVRHTPGMWEHDTNDTLFTLVVDDFVIKYTSKTNVSYLLNVIKEKYKISEDWLGSRYIGITLD